MDLRTIIERMDALKAELDELRPIQADRLSRLNQKLRLDWNYHSNSIEGNTLSMSETKSFILWGVTAKGKPFRDYLEMRGHNEALKKLFEIVQQDLKITESLIKDFHRMILVEPYTDSKAEINPGEWKNLNNYILTRTAERIDFVDAEEVPERMNRLINWLNNHLNPPKRKKQKYDLHPLLIAAGFHTEFIKIHPFGDGNGRMARILTNLILMSCGYTPAIVELDSRLNYYTAINTSNLDTPENLAIFLGGKVVESLEMAIMAAKGKSIEEEDDIDKELKLIAQRLEAETNITPLKSKERIEELIQTSIFPFFDELVSELIRFDNLFERIYKGILVNGGGNNLPIEKRKLQVLLQSKKSKVNNLALSYSFFNLKNYTKEHTIDLDIKFDFLRAKYQISSNCIDENLELKYNQTIETETQIEWIKAIKKAILNKIKEALN